ncbi:MAG TPA: Nudix family hydrolase [Gammaproteobacteria bacterium]|nr:Nudix family hydrolase [Gammaproteobacteria bacterium]
MSDLIHVAVGVIINSKNEVLISLRHKSTHQGGLWEFPGGKVEAGESVFDALKREISEELNIVIKKAEPFKLIQHQYEDKSVCLDVWIVESFSGEPTGAEGQLIKWQPVNQLNIEEFPAANRSIIHSLALPDKYMITGVFESASDFLERLESSLKKGVRLVQMRCKKLSDSDFLSLAEQAQFICKKYRANLLLNTTPDVFYQTKSSGLHLSSQQLNLFDDRPVNEVSLLSVSCHTPADIKQAERLSADLILVSPVKETSSHPGVKGIGWEGFTVLVSNTHIPAYALGGMGMQDIEDAKFNNAQGVAAISSFWNAQ